MPKGDRLKLKADPEDGTTPIANLLLEAVVMAKLSGMQKGAILYLWRRTYGWTDENGKRKKEEKIPLSEWKKALDSSAPRVSETLSELEKRGIIKRHTADIWGGYYYSMNTDISKWNSNCINLAKLCETVGIPDFGIVTENRTVPQISNSSPNEQQFPKSRTIPEHSVSNQVPITENRTVTEKHGEQLPKTELPTLYKEIINKDIKKGSANFVDLPTNVNTKGDIGVSLRKKGYGVNNIVKLTDDEYEKLLTKFGDVNLKYRIDNLATWLGSNGKQKKSHYLTILNWALRDSKEATLNGKYQKNTPRPLPTTYTEPEDL